MYKYNITDIPKAVGWIVGSPKREEMQDRIIDDVCIFSLPYNDMPFRNEDLERMIPDIGESYEIIFRGVSTSVYHLVHKIEPFNDDMTSKNNILECNLLAFLSRMHLFGGSWGAQVVHKEELVIPSEEEISESSSPLSSLFWNIEMLNQRIKMHPFLVDNVYESLIGSDSWREEMAFLGEPYGF